MENPYIDVLRLKDIIAVGTPVKVAFLDCDGVMNNKKMYDNQRIKKILKKGRTGDYIFDPSSCLLLNKLVQKSNLLLFISSDIRNDVINGKQFLPAMVEVFAQNGICEKPVGITPFLYDTENNPERGKEIDYVLSTLGQKGMIIERYVILDDFDEFILPHQKEYFVKCNSEKGFQEEEYLLAERILMGD